MEDDEYFALELDNEWKQGDTLTSNNGHPLWSGIVDTSKSLGWGKGAGNGRFTSTVEN